MHNILPHSKEVRRVLIINNTDGSKDHSTGRRQCNQRVSPESLDRRRHLPSLLCKRSFIFLFSPQRIGPSLHGAPRILSGQADCSLSAQIPNLPLFCLLVHALRLLWDFQAVCVLRGAGGYCMSRQAAGLEKSESSWTGNRKKSENIE